MSSAGTFWQKGSNTRMEGEIEGQEMVVMVDNEEKVAYTYMPAQGIAVEVGLGEVEEVQEGSLKEHSTELPDYNPVIKGSEIINGMDCLVVGYTHEDGNTGTMWIWKDYGLPVKIETENTVMEAENISFAEISDEKFELPEGVEVMDMSVPAF
jgi:outer membrane lipoprotein-sorting protein